MSVMEKCTGHDCWDCRANIDAQLKVLDCGHRFTRMHNIAAARRLYDEKQYYYPVFFRWEDPVELKSNPSKFLHHPVILLGKTGDVRSGVMISPHSAPTEYEVFTEDSVWIRWSCLPDRILVYPIKSVVAFIDLATYSDKRTHPFRVSEHHGIYNLECDLPF